MKTNRRDFLRTVGWASLAGDPETGYVYAQNVDGKLVALDRAGKKVWERRLGEELSEFDDELPL